MAHSAYRKTYENFPDLWDQDPSFLLKAQCTNGVQFTLASGWHRRQIEFENVGIEFTDTNEPGIGIIWINTPNSSTSIPWETIELFDLEVSLDQSFTEEFETLIAKLSSTEASTKILSSIDEMITRVSANRANKSIDLASGETIDSVDLLTQNLPARSGNMDEALRSLSRWCRIFELDSGTITIYRELDESSKKQLRWPHNCIFLNRGIRYYNQPSEAIGSIEEAFKIPLEYEFYNLDNWRVEFEFWENRPFQVVVTEDSEVAADRLSITLREISILSDFITTAFLVSRNLRRRIDQNPIVIGNARVKEYAQQSLTELEETIRIYRELLEKALEMMANTSQSVQAIANRESAEATEKTNSFLTLATAIFFIPTMIISFYSMSIIGEHENAVVPSTMFVLILCICSAVLGGIGVLLVRVLQKRKKARRAKLLTEGNYLS